MPRLLLWTLLQLPDGANAMIIGELGEMGEPLLFVGGNCAIQGFDHQGEDKFWTVSWWGNICGSGVGVSIVVNKVEYAKITVVLFTM